MANKNMSYREEKILSPSSGFPALIISSLLLCASLAGLILAAVSLEQETTTWAVVAVSVSGAYLCLIGWIPLLGLKILQPNEAAVYTLFGRYYGTINKPGFFFINPFCLMFAPAGAPSASAVATAKNMSTQIQLAARRKVSLKAITLDNARQKINDRDGNPIDIGVVVIWRVVNATQAVFEVDNYREYVSTQADAAIRHIARQYPYDISEEGDETSLRGSASAVADEMKRDLQARVVIAGIEIIETRIAHLAYAQEIAAAMLQRQQADALIAARQKIVEGAVGMVEMALSKLSENKVVELDEERKAAMVSNLLVVLCGSREAQPVVNSGSLY
jgi:regulator of protease activity HflC (stomatin/prohibitin superfamily)